MNSADKAVTILGVALFATIAVGLATCDLDSTPSPYNCARACELAGQVMQKASKTEGCVCGTRTSTEAER